MSNFLKKYILTFLILNFCLIARSQFVDNIIADGDAAFSLGNYENARILYNEAIKTDGKNMYAWFQLGRSAMNYFDYKESYHYFKFVYENDSLHEYPLAVFYLGELSRNMSDYNMAKTYYSIFLETTDSDNLHKEKAKEQLYNIDKLLSCKNNKDSISIEHISIPINSPYSETSGFQINDNYLIFTSLRPLLKTEGSGILDNSFLTSVYVSKFTHQGLALPNLFDETINSKNEHTANICFNEDYSIAWFNRCKMNGNYKWKCDIYESSLIEDKWTKPRRLNINSETATTTQAYYYGDSTGNGIMYFSSNREGGFGEMDLWFSIRKNGTFGQPINCGSIVNSPGNEITPFYDATEKKLYFSSDWYCGFGSYDIFWSSGSHSAWSKPKNAGIPLNSPANDFAFNINKLDKDGYFTSNRNGSYSLKNETCCNDLYAYYVYNKIDSTVSDTFISTISPLKNKIKNLLPLDLYFHNDCPNPRSRDSLTTTNYIDTYYEYTSMFEKYLKEYCKGLSNHDKNEAYDNIEKFFLHDVSDGLKKLMCLLPLMREDLAAGSSVKIKIKGFTSPLTSTDYNILLAKRRINSVINNILAFDNSVLQKSFDNGQLKIFSDPVGEVLSDSFVSDNPNDKRNSIYSIAAAKERKIQIVSYESNFIKQNLSTSQKAILTFSTNELVFDINNDSSFCKNIIIQNIGGDTLKIKDISSKQAWISAFIDNIIIIPNESIKLKICINPQLIKNKPLGFIVLNSNSIDDKNIIYVRIK